MAIVNGYSTLQNVKDSFRVASVDATDDAAIERLVEGASRYIDLATGRTFYARTETRLYDASTDDVLWLDDDLLTITTLTNGDGTIIGAANYLLLPVNSAPKFAVRLKQSSGVYWATSAAGDTRAVVSVAGTWGYAASTPNDIRLACEAIVIAAYRNRFGDGAGGAATITAAGVVITPKDIPGTATAVLTNYRRYPLAGV